MQAPLVGRARELASLRKAAADLKRAPAVVLVSGEAGIGKSALVEQFAREMRGGGLRVLSGGCVELAGDPIPYAPLAEVIRKARREAADSGILGDQQNLQLDYFLQIRHEQHPQGRAELFERALGLIDSFTQGHTEFVLIFEDLHWADQSTLDFIAFLTRNAPEGLLFLLTYRDDELGSRPGLQALLGGVASNRITRRIVLRRLASDEMAELVEQVRGRSISKAEARHVFVRSEGNPFLAQELLIADDEGGFQNTLDDVLLARATRLSSQAEEVMRTVAIVGRAVTHDVLVSAVGFTDELLASALREAVSCGLLSVDADRETYTFRHVLTQEAVLNRMLPGERRRLHAAVAQAIELTPDSSSSVSTAAECATHWWQSADHSAALEAAIRAAGLAIEVYAYTEASLQFTRALELWDRVPDAEAVGGMSRSDILMAAAESARWNNAPHRSLELAQSALELTTAELDQVRIIERIGTYYWESDRVEEARSSFERAYLLLSTYPRSTLTATVASSRAHFMLLSSQYRAAIPAAREAVGLALSVDAPVPEGWARITLGMSLVFDGELRDGTEQVRRGYELIRASGGLDDRRRAVSNLSYALLMAGQTADACEIAMSGVAMIRRYGLEAASGAGLTANTIVLLRLAGRWGEALELSDEVLASDLQMGSARFFLDRAELDIARGEFDEARLHLDHAWRMAGQAAPTKKVDLLLAESELLLERKQPLAARERLLDAMNELPPAAPARLVLSVYGSALRAEADIAESAAWTKNQASPGPTPDRDALFALVKEVSQTPLSPELSAMAVTAEAEYLRGGHMNNDYDMWRSAAHAWERIGRPYEQAYCCLQSAEALLKAGQSASLATEPLRQGFELAVRLGAASLEHHAHEVARRSRISLTQIPAERSARTTPAEEFGLTARETDVLRALTQGLTNRDIGKQLFLSHRTVAIYVSNLLGKLHVSTRGQAAAAATRLGLFDDLREDDR